MNKHRIVIWSGFFHGQATFQIQPGYLLSILLCAKLIQKPLAELSHLKVCVLLSVGLIILYGAFLTAPVKDLLSIMQRLPELQVNVASGMLLQVLKQHSLELFVAKA